MLGCVNMLLNSEELIHKFSLDKRKYVGLSTLCAVYSICPNKDSNKCKACPIKHFLLRSSFTFGRTAGRLKPSQLNSPKVEPVLYAEDFWIFHFQYVCSANFGGWCGKRIQLRIGYAYKIGMSGDTR